MPITYDMLTQLDQTGWELYNLNEDWAETNNLAEKESARLTAMIGMWYAEAGKYNVLPIDSRGTQRIAEERPQIASIASGTSSLPHAIDPGIRRAENPEPTVLDHRRSGDPRRRSRGCVAQHGRQ